MYFLSVYWVDNVRARAIRHKIANHPHPYRQALAWLLFAVAALLIAAATPAVFLFVLLRELVRVLIEGARGGGSGRHLDGDSAGMF